MKMTTTTTATRSWDSLLPVLHSRSLLPSIGIVDLYHHVDHGVFEIYSSIMLCFLLFFSLSFFFLLVLLSLRRGPVGLRSGRAGVARWSVCSTKANASHLCRRKIRRHQVFVVPRHAKLTVGYRRNCIQLLGNHLSDGMGCMASANRVPTNHGLKRNVSDCTALIVHPRFHHQLRSKPEVFAPSYSFPKDCFPLLLAYFDAVELERAALVCKAWYFYSMTDRYWVRLCQRDFCLNPTTSKEYAAGLLHARTLYQRLYVGRQRLIREEQAMMQSNFFQSIPTWQVSQA